MSRSITTRFLPWLLVVAAVVVYYNSLSSPFIFDDEYSILGNEQIRQLWPLSRALRGPEQTSVAGRPVVSISLALNYALTKLDVRGYRALNIAIHILGSLVLFGIVRRTLLSEKLPAKFGPVASRLAFVSALLWMLHPIHTECINYITQRTELFMGLFYLLTLYCAIRALRSEHHLSWYGLSILSCGLGMASKEAMVTAPLMVVLYDWVFKSVPFKEMLRRRWPLYVGLGATWIFLALLMWSGPRSDTVGLSHGVSGGGYAMNQCIMIVKYLQLIIWPHPLVLDYGYPEPLTIAQVAPYAIILAVLLIATFAVFIYRPMTGLPGVWFFVILGPTSSFIPIITEVGAERRMYLSSAGLIVLLVATGYILTRRLVKQQPSDEDTRTLRRKGLSGAGWFLVLAIAAALAWVTVRRNQDYQNPETIWRSVVAAVPDNPTGYHYLGNAFIGQGKIDKAIAQYQQALKLRPDYVHAVYNLGNAYLQQGQTERAIDYYRRTLGLRSDYAMAYFNLGLIFESQGQYDEAIGHFLKAIESKKDYPEAYYNLADVLLRLGKYAEAIGYYKRAIQYKSNFDDAHSNLGTVLATLGRFDEAIEHYRRAIQIKGGFPERYFNLGYALQLKGDIEEAMKQYRRALQLDNDFFRARQNLAYLLSLKGKFNEAIEHYRQVLQEQPDWLKPNNDLAWILATCPDEKVRDPKEAVRLAERAAELAEHKNAVVLDTLAAAYAAAGEFAKAIETCQKGLELAVEGKNEVLAEQIGQRLKLYGQSKSYGEAMVR